MDAAGLGEHDEPEAGSLDRPERQSEVGPQPVHHHGRAITVNDMRPEQSEDGTIALAEVTPVAVQGDPVERRRAVVDEGAEYELEPQSAVEVGIDREIVKLSAGYEVAHPVRHGLARRGEVIEQGVLVLLGDAKEGIEVGRRGELRVLDRPMGLRPQVEHPEDRDVGWDERGQRGRDRGGKRLKTTPGVALCQEAKNTAQIPVCQPGHGSSRVRNGNRSPPSSTGRSRSGHPLLRNGSARAFGHRLLTGWRALIRRLVG